VLDNKDPTEDMVTVKCQKSLHTDGGITYFEQEQTGNKGILITMQGWHAHIDTFSDTLALPEVILHTRYVTACRGKCQTPCFLFF